LTKLPALPANVRDVFETYESATQTALLNLRTLIFEVADTETRIGPLIETLKWGQISYLPRKPKTGTTVRLAQSKSHPATVSVLVPCGTSLVDQWRQHYGDTLTLIGKRELIIPLQAPAPEAAIRHCIALALTYHLKD